MATFELSDEEIKVITDSLRASERHSRHGFARTLQTLVHKPCEAIKEKTNRAIIAWRRYELLRAKFGDDKPLRD